MRRFAIRFLPQQETKATQAGMPAKPKTCKERSVRCRGCVYAATALCVLRGRLRGGACVASQVKYLSHQKTKAAQVGILHRNEEPFPSENRKGCRSVKVVYKKSLKNQKNVS